MKLAILHRTVFEYGEPARDNVNEVRLRPLERHHQSCEFFLLKVLPASRLQKYCDLFRNLVHHFQVTGPHSRLVIEAMSRVTTTSPLDYAELPYGTPHSALAECRDHDECHEFLQDSTFIRRFPEMWREAIDLKDESDDVFQTAYQLMQSIFESCLYQPGMTDANTTVDDFFYSRSGVCQDFAHLMIAYCRCLGIPARYVSGYIYDPALEGARKHMRGAHASHAWVEIFLPGTGWIGFDPTNNKVVNNQYVAIATGRDYGDIAPVQGTFYGGGHHRTMHVEVDVSPVT